MMCSQHTDTSVVVRRRKRHSWSWTSVSRPIYTAGVQLSVAVVLLSVLLSAASLRGHTPEAPRLLTAAQQGFAYPRLVLIGRLSKTVVIDQCEYISGMMFESG
jgi:hypothetical protein